MRELSASTGRGITTACVVAQHNKMLSQALHKTISFKEQFAHYFPIDLC